MTIYEVGWTGDSNMAIDKDFVEAETPDKAAEIYFNYYSPYDHLNKFLVREAKHFSKTYFVARIPSKDGSVYRTVKSGWYLFAWI